jgi:hypothetical protein
MPETIPPDEDNSVLQAVEGKPGVDPNPQPELYTDDQEKEDDEDGS